MKTKTNHFTITRLTSGVRQRASIFIAALFCFASSYAFAQNVTVNPGAGSYPTLKAAFDAINAGTHTGAVTVDIVASTTEGATPATLNSSGAGSASYTSVVIRPAADGLSVSGNPAQGLGVIQLNGVDNVTIDGDNPNTSGTNRNLTVSNTAAAATTFGSAIRFATSATAPFDSNNNNTIKNLILSGNVTGGNLSTITATTTSANNSFGVVVGPNGGASVTALASVTTAVAAGVTVNGLVIDNNAISQCGRGVSFLGTAAASSTGVTISNNAIGDQGAVSPATPPYTSPTTTVYTKGILVSGTASITIAGNTINNIISYVGITTTSIELTATVTNSTITNNVIANVANNGTVSIVKAVLVSATTGSYSIAGNSITNVQALAGSSGTDGMEITAASTAGTIERNKIQTVYNRNTGTFGAFGLNLTAGTGIVIRNNFVSDVNMNMTGGGAFSTTFGLHGIRIAGGTGHKVYHNSVNLFGALLGTSTTAILTSAFTPTATTITGMDVRNNIFANTMTGGTTGVAHVSMFLPSSGTSAMNLTINNNDYFSGTTAGQSGIAHVGTTYTSPPAGPTTYAGLYTAANFNPGDTAATTNLRTYTNILSAAGTNDNASKVVDPQFLSNTDLHIAVASPMVDMGASVGVLQDIDGQNRVPPPDIGADEPSGVTPPANDISAAAITTPANGSSFAIGAVVTPQATFTNVGTATQTGVMVQFTITGPGGYSYTDTQTIATIAPNQTVTVTFAAAPAFTTAGAYNMAATVTTPDANAANDQVTGSFTVLAPLSGSYNVPGDYPSLTNAGGIFAAINAAGATGNITINMTADSTAETGANALNQIAGGFTVLIKPSGAARIISGTSTGSGLIKLNGADGVTIDGSTVGGTDRSLTITNSNAAGVDIWIASASASNGANNDTVKNCILTGTTGIGGTIAGVLSGSGTTFGNPADAPNSNNTIQNNLVIKVQNACFLSGNAASFDQNWVVTGNTFGSTVVAEKLGFRGMLIGGAQNMNVTNNTIMGVNSSTGTSSTMSGIQVSALISGGSITGNKISDIKQNNTAGWGSNGIYLTATSTTSNLLVANNFISDVASQGFNGATSTDNGYGIMIDTGAGYKIYFNSVNLNTNQGAGAANGITAALNIAAAVTTAGGIDLRDNILADTQTLGTRYGVYDSSTAGAAIFSNIDYNDYFAQNVGFLTSARPTLANWQAATGQDLNSKAVDPLFVSATDLHLQTSSPLVGMGFSIAGVTNDIDGDARPQGNGPEIGADELPNTAPTITAVPVTREQGSQVSNSTIANVNDVDTGANSVTVTVTSANPSNGVTISNIVNTNGTVTADVVASCTASTATFTLQASDGSLTSTDTLTVTVTADTAPILTYNNASVAFNGSTTVNPATGPSDNGSVASIVVQSTGTYTGTISVDNTTGVVSISNAAPTGTHTITIRATDNCGLTTDATFTLTVPDTAPTITAATGVTRQQGSPASNSTIATVNDTESGAGAVVVTVTSPNPSNGVTISNIVNTNGTVTADVVADCTATTATFTLQASDGTLTSTDTLTVTVTADAAPTLTYNNASVAFNGSTTVNPATGPSDNGSVSTIAVQSQGTYTGTISVNNAGVVSISNAAPAGTHTITIRATDNCGLTTDATFTLTVGAAPNADLSNLTVSAGPLSPPFDPNTLSYTVNTPFTTTSTTVTPTAADPGSTITVNGNPVASGSPSGPIPLNVGNNTITIVVTASDMTTTKTYTVNVIRGGPVVVSGSTGADGSYATLKLAFDALNANGTQAGNVISVSLQGDTTETVAAVLNQPSVSSWTSLTITPSGARTVSGSLTTPLIDLAGADNVTINGLNSAGNTLTISNTSTSATASTIRLINGATSDTVTNCSVLGSSTGAVAAATGNILIGTSTSGANNGNTISNNDIGPAGANLPTKGFTSLGSTSPNNNTGNVVDNNNIFDFFSPTISVAGISLQANTTTMTVSNNRLYQTAPRTFTAAVSYTGISAAMGTGAGTATITGNKIGFGASNGTGTTTISGNANTFAGLSLASASTTTPTSIQNNTVSGINVSSAGNAVVVFTGIVVGSGRYDVGTTTGNKIGSLDGSSTITVTLSSAGAVYCLRDANTTAISNSISNNQVGAITINGTGTGANGFRGILPGGTSTGASATVNNNQIGGSGAGAITDSLVGGYAMYAISGGAGNMTAIGNTIQNISGNSNAATTIVISGILATGTGTVAPNLISQNVIHSLSNNSGAASNSIYALYCSFPAATANVVERNFVHSLSITSTNLASQLVGILPVAGTGTYKNNMVRLGIDASGASITPGYVIYGMFEIAGTNNLYDNSVYIGGSGVASSSNTFAFVSNVVTNVRNYKDNIFWNARSNASGGGKNYAISVGGTTPNPAGLTSNFNDLFANGTGGFVGLFNATDQLTLANWQAATGQDANSISANPQFVNPTGTAATVDLHINCASPADGSGTPVAGITNDFDNETRNATTPDIGADEINLTPPTPVSAVSHKVHGAAGPFDINLPFAGPAGIESRSGGATGAYEVIFTFSAPVNVSGAVVSAGTGSVSLVSGSGTNTITVDLTGVANAQYLTVKLLCVDDGVNLGSVSATMGVLVADATADGNVNGTDVSQVKLNVGSVVDGTNFRSDVDANGNINATDVSQAKLKSGTALPP